MDTIDDTRPKTAAPVDYYRSQAEKCRRAANAPDITQTVRDTYLELARQWEDLSLEMSEPH
jgi:hypothetical protein